MKSIKFIVSILAAGLLISLPLSYANNAPVEDLSVASNDDGSVVAQNDQTEQQPNNALQPPAESPNANTSTSTDNIKNYDERLDRVEQQISNIADMNLPQQIEELRQEAQQLNGRIQVQRHDIKVLENQQRSFYQDLNRRIQQIISSGGISLTQKQQQSNAAKPMTTSVELKDSAAYRSAFNLLVKKQYDDALGAFQSYIRIYPHGDFVANAYYWMGELYLKKNDTEMAVKSFGQVVSEYPNSNKVPDAKLKLAIVHANQGNIQQARQELLSIKKQYPNSTAAQLSSIQLQRMGQ